MMMMRVNDDDDESQSLRMYHFSSFAIEWLFSNY